jgi:hypothetical protein
MTVCTADEEVWGDTHMSIVNEISAFTSLRLPRLAASIKAIDGVSASELFQFADDMSDTSKQYHSETPGRKRYWEMSQMLLWLGDQSNPLITDLWNSYVDLATRRDKSWAELKKL